MTTERFKEIKKNLCKEGFEISNQEFIEYERINKDHLLNLFNSKIIMTNPINDNESEESVDLEEDLEEYEDYVEEGDYYHS